MPPTSCSDLACRFCRRHAGTAALRIRTTERTGAAQPPTRWVAERLTALETLVQQLYGDLEEERASACHLA